MEKRQQKALAAGIKRLATLVRSFTSAHGNCNRAFQNLLFQLSTAETHIYEQEQEGDTTATVIKARAELVALMTSLMTGFQEIMVSFSDHTYDDVVAVKITQPLGRLYYALDVVPKTAPKGTPRVEAQAITRQASELPPMTVVQAVELVRASLNAFVLLAVTLNSESAVVWSKAKKAYKAASGAEQSAHVFESHQQGSTPRTGHGRTLSAPVAATGDTTTNYYNSAAHATLARTTSEVASTTSTNADSSSSTSVARLMDAIENAIVAYERTTVDILKSYAELTHVIVGTVALQDDPSLFSEDSNSVTPMDSLTTIPHTATAADAAGSRVKPLAKPHQARRKIVTPSTPQQFAKLVDDLVGDCLTMFSPARFSYTGLQVREKTTHPLTACLSQHDLAARNYAAKLKKVEHVAPHVVSALATKRTKHFEQVYAQMGTAVLSLVEIESDLVTHALRLLTPYVI